MKTTTTLILLLSLIYFSHVTAQTVQNPEALQNEEAPVFDDSHLNANSNNAKSEAQAEEKSVRLTSDNETSDVEVISETSKADRTSSNESKNVVIKQRKKQKESKKI